ncbi:TonB family protein [Nitrospirillum amazonense]|uniref:TonB family protein n=1 Tax=Nitrospirillum amazonense TaxID=28077 RepID=A0A560FMG9_9PROT|nr:TonB family protein [Nitrospirillum amazonense]TWB22807.1 TonB family protein [Nitrospirillum amazonense]
MRPTLFRIVSARFLSSLAMASAAGCAHAPPPAPVPTSHIDRDALLAADGPKLDPATLMKAIPSYPWVAVEQGQVGTVTLALLCEPGGQVTDAEVMEGSGSDRLDAAALAAGASGKWRCVPGTGAQTPPGPARPAWITLRYTFRQRDHRNEAAAPAADAPAAPPGPALGARIDLDTVVQPPYPADALPTGEYGVVPFKFRCGADGQVVEAQLTQPGPSIHPHLDSTVLAAARAGVWRCNPAKRPSDHQPIDSWGFHRLVFAAPAASGPSYGFKAETDGAQLDHTTLAHADYTVDAARAGEEGRVVIDFLCGVNGRLGDFKISHSSGHLRLDAAALAALRSPQVRCVPGTSAATGRIRVTPGAHQAIFQLSPDAPRPGEAPVLDIRSLVTAPPAYPRSAPSSTQDPKDQTTLTAALLCGPGGTLLDSALMESSGHPELDAAFMAATDSGLWRCLPAQLRTTGQPVAAWTAYRQYFGRPAGAPPPDDEPVGAAVDPASLVAPGQAPATGAHRKQPKAWLRFWCGANGQILTPSLFRSSGNPHLDADLITQARSGKWRCLTYQRPGTHTAVPAWGFFPYSGPAPEVGARK